MSITLVKQTLLLVSTDHQTALSNSGTTALLSESLSDAYHYLNS